MVVKAESGRATRNLVRQDLPSMVKAKRLELQSLLEPRNPVRKVADNSLPQEATITIGVAHKAPKHGELRGKPANGETTDNETVKETRRT